MKKLLTALLHIIPYMFIKAQEEPPKGELVIRIVNNPNERDVTVKLQLISELCWDANDQPGYEDVHNLTDLFTGTTLVAEGGEEWVRFFVCWRGGGIPPELQFGLGRYLVTASYVLIDEQIHSDFFYIDYRTSHLPEATLGTGCMIDLPVDFNVEAAKFYYYDTQNEFPATTTFWDLRTCVDHITTELEPLPPVNFQLSSSGGYPYLTWSHSTAGDYWTDFAVYRSVTSGCGSSPGSFTKIATISETATDYTDYNFIVGGPITAHYKMVAVNGNRESEFTDIKNICVSLYKEGTEQESYTYRLNQNYPNPFNPSTFINYSIKENVFVILKIYDLLGRQVATLIEDYREAGNYSIEFNAQEFESGIYFYEIKAGDFRDVKKLILLK